MRPHSKPVLFWAPRVLCLLFAAFISLFALDVLEGSRGFWQTTISLLRHLIPTAVLLALLTVSWRWEWVGGVLFPALGIFYLVMFWGRVHWSAYVVIAGPLFMLGALFLVNWRQRKNSQSAGAVPY